MTKMHSSMKNENVFCMKMRYSSSLIGLVAFLTFAMALSGAVVDVFGQSRLFPGEEKLTYRILFDGYENAGYAELQIVGSGRLGDREAVELRSKIKTTNFVGAALVQVNERRITYVDPASGLPIYSKLVDDPDAFARESSVDFRSGATSFDVVSLIHALRRQSGRGSIAFTDKGTSYSVEFRDGKSEKVRSGTGDFETVLSVLESDYFKTIGIWEVRVNFSRDSRRIPVEVRLRTKMGKMRILLASIQIPSPVGPTLGITPRVDSESGQTAKSPTQLQSVPFSSGERTNLRISRNGRQLGEVALQVGQPVSQNGEQFITLLASVSVANAEDMPFKMGDSFASRVRATSLLPVETLSRLSSSWSEISGRYTYDQENGSFKTDSGESGSMASATHDLISFLYALRAFNLNPSTSPVSPVNDTRVSVLLGNRNLFFTVRPSQVEAVTIGGKKQLAQMLTIVTGDPEIDQLSPRVWLGDSKGRSILKVSIGDFVAESF
jgi:hypothetical protein